MLESEANKAILMRTMLMLAHCVHVTMSEAFGQLPPFSLTDIISQLLHF